MKEDLENYKKTIETMTRELVENYGIKGIDISVDIDMNYNSLGYETSQSIAIGLNIKC